MYHLYSVGMFERHLFKEPFAFGVGKDLRHYLVQPLTLPQGNENPDMLSDLSKVLQLEEPPSSDSY